MDNLVERVAEAMRCWTTGEPDIRGRVWVRGGNEPAAFFASADEAHKEVGQRNARAIIPIVMEEAAKVALEWNLPSIASAGCDPGTARNIAQSIRTRSSEIAGLSKESE